MEYRKHYVLNYEQYFFCLVLLYMSIVQVKKINFCEKSAMERFCSKNNFRILPQKEVHRKRY